MHDRQAYRRYRELSDSGKEPMGPLARGRISVHTKDPGLQSPRGQGLNALFSAFFLRVLAQVQTEQGKTAAEHSRRIAGAHQVCRSTR